MPRTTKKKRKNSKRPNALALRTERSVTFKDENNQEQKLKTSALIDPDYIDPNYTPERLTKELHKQFKEIETHTPIHEILLESENGSVLKGKSKSGAIVRRVAKYGSFNLFSNNPMDTLVETKSSPVQIEEAYYQSDLYQSLKKVQEDIKNKTLKITPECLEAAKKENAKLGKRSKTQKQIMGESATVAALLLKKEGKWEWLHLVAHSIGGDKSTQNKENLVGGSNYANTDMIFAESQIEYLSEHYPNGFELTVTAILEKDTEIAKTIEYKIKSDDFSIVFEFDAQAKNKPHIINKEYFSKYVETFVKDKKTKNQFDSSPISPTQVLYSKKRKTTIQTDSPPSTPLSVKKRKQ